jgi:alginate O-acetyltransferase complex protein AlgI
VQFNSYLFGAFLVVVLAVYNLPFIGWRGQKVWLLVASYIFYAAWDPVFIPLLWMATVVDWFASRWISRASSQRARRAILVISLVVNLGVLAYFKYGAFLLENFVAVVNGLGIDYAPARPSIVLPIGISFYIFHTLSYTMDVYLGRTKPWASVLDFALYVTFFPALVAGPILRASQFLPQCATPRRTTRAHLSWGLSLLILGLFQKVVLADVVFAHVVDDVFTPYRVAGLADAWLGTLAFTGQIISDFAGYSTCALGVAMCLGFSLPDNFRFPYAARGFSDFWRRWHISLSTWLRDYLYIPLGGNRHGNERTQLNLMLTMLIGGLWHGASWTFVMWGGLHGIYLVGERWLVAALPTGPWRESRAARVAAAAITFALVCLAWVFFRSGTFDQAFALVRAMVGLSTGEETSQLASVDRTLVLAAIGAILVTHAGMRDTSIEELATRTPAIVRGLALALMIASIVVMQGEDRAFIYFQF